MDCDDSYGNASPMAAAEEPHADPEMKQPPSTEEDANLATFFNRAAHFAPSVPPTPSVPRFGLTFALRAGEWDGVVRVRADHAHRHGGVDGRRRPRLSLGGGHGCPAGDKGGRGDGAGVRGVPQGLRGGGHVQDDAVRARVPRALHLPVATGQTPLPVLPLRAAGYRSRTTMTMCHNESLQFLFNSY
ncbi:unnamed protein product [Urochloa humidicola]